ncbi:lipocalin-like domain-containing protein [Bradyrhizobium diazoefficiens]|nr:lipocalin-like domain-containing protein [Bradyrhizobium diazoefficiens]
MVPTLQELTGSWTLVDAKVEFENGEQKDIYGPSPSGSIMFADNRMMAVLTSSARLPSAAPDELFRTMMAYTGTFKLQGAELTINVDTAWTPSWVGTTQKRSASLDDAGLLSLRTEKQGHPLYPGQQVVGLLTWRK